MLYTTLNAIREASPCPRGWKTLLQGLGKTEVDAEPLAFSTILEIVGIEDTLWVLGQGPKGARICHEFTCKAAECVIPVLKHYPRSAACARRGIETKRAWVRGEATDCQLERAQSEFSGHIKNMQEKMQQWRASESSAATAIFLCLRDAPAWFCAQSVTRHSWHALNRLDKWQENMLKSLLEESSNPRGEAE